jgi:hypothetical protein
MGTPQCTGLSANTSPCIAQSINSRVTCLMYVFGFFHPRLQKEISSHGNLHHTHIIMHPFSFGDV